MQKIPNSIVLFLVFVTGLLAVPTLLLISFVGFMAGYTSDPDDANADDGCLSQQLTRAEYVSSARHEAGHTVVALALHPDWYEMTGVYPNGTVVDDDGCAEGATYVSASGDLTRQDMIDQITIELGGYAEDLLTFRQPSSGSSRDIRLATVKAVVMVDNLGMGDGMPPYDYGLLRDNGVALGSDLDMRRSKEIRKILDDAYAQASLIVGFRQDDVERISDGLLASPTYTLTAADVQLMLTTSCPPDDDTCLPRE